MTGLGVAMLGLSIGGKGEVRGATFVVDSSNDQGPGSFRQAVMDSNQAGGTNRIVFTNSVAYGTWILLWSGEVVISNSVTILAAEKNIALYNPQKVDRVLRIVNGTVNIYGMTMLNGSNYIGGSILQEGGTLTLSNCTVSGNAATFGGGIAQTGGTLEVIDSTISSNRVAGTGMGIYVQAGVSTTLRRCTLVGNSGIGFTAASGGGVSHNGTSLILDSCTFFANGSTGGNGGGVLNTAGNAKITNCTFYANASFTGGGVVAQAGTVTLRNTLVAGNTTIISGAGGAPDCMGTFISGGFNLIGNRTNSTGWIASDLVGTTASPVNPQLGNLQPNGGLTWTIEPMLGSPAIDRGHSSGATSDQRGYLRPHDKSFLPNLFGGDGGDIGAFETGTKTNVVTNLNTSGPGSLRQAVLDAGIDDLTTITFAPGIVGNTLYLSGSLYIDKDVIIYGPGASALSLVAGPGQRLLEVGSRKTVISGFTFRDCSSLSEDGENGSDGSSERAGAIINFGDLFMSDCIISNNVIHGGNGGNVTGLGLAGDGGKAQGGAIGNYWMLYMTRCIVASNSATGGARGTATGGGSDGTGGDAYGGAIYSEGGVFLTNCTIYGNYAGGGAGNGFSSGGGIYNYSTMLNLINCTIAQNTAFSGTGGGVYDGGATGIYRHTTIASNSASSGGGLYVSGADMGNTIVAANDAGTGRDMQGGYVSSDYNFIGWGNGWYNIGPLDHTFITADAMLGPLQNNGGPTPTMALLPGSPAIDSGKSFGIMVDQRGRTRPFDFAELANVSGGDGSDIGAFEVGGGAILHITRSGTNAQLTWSTNNQSFVLEYTTNLSAGGTWSNVAGTPSVAGNEFLVLDPLVGRKFFRLRGP
jgi:hypothetical protein